MPLVACAAAQNAHRELCAILYRICIVSASRRFTVRLFPQRPLLLVALAAVQLLLQVDLPMCKKLDLYKMHSQY